MVEVHLQEGEFPVNGRPFWTGASQPIIDLKFQKGQPILNRPGLRVVGPITSYAGLNRWQCPPTNRSRPDTPPIRLVSGVHVPDLKAYHDERVLEAADPPLS